MYETKFHDKDLSTSSFLVTGGAGFIGSNLVEYLMKYRAGKVRVLDNFATGFRKNIEPYLNEASFELIEGDIRDFKTCQKACDGMDFVLHQAALGSVPRSINDPITSNEVNVSGHLNMLTAARDANVSRFTYAASSSTYGDSKELPKREDRIGKPLSPYAVTKYVNELYADVFARTYGFKTVGLRYFNVFGPRQDPKGAYAAVIPLFMDAVIREEPPYFNGAGDQTRDFTFIENVVQANIRSLMTDNEEALDQVYNVAVGDRTSLIELFNHIKSIAGSDLQPKHRDPRAGDIQDSLADISKGKELLGYQPQVKIREGLERTFHWFKENYEFIHTK